MTKAISSDRLHILAGHLATVALVAILASTFDVVGRPFAIGGFLTVMVAILVLFFTRNTDEWIASLWLAGASAGFIGAIAWLVFLPFSEGLYDGFTGNGAEQDLPADAASIVALVCFVCAHNLKRIRGA